MATPTQEDYEELILSCRYGDREDVESFISQFGVDHLATARDDNGNTILHMAAANGHTGMSISLFASHSPSCFFLSVRLQPQNLPFHLTC